LALGVGGLQFILDKGNELGWLSSHTIQLAVIISAMSSVVFVIRCLGQNDSLVNLKIFKDKNYTLSCIMMLLYCSALLGTFSWLPLWLAATHA
jgi:DHA2 family multidrug resistance protein